MLLIANWVFVSAALWQQRFDILQLECEEAAGTQSPGPAIHIFFCDVRDTPVSGFAAAQQLRQFGGTHTLLKG